MSDVPLDETPSYVEPFSRLQPQTVTWLWLYRLAFGTLAILDGDPGEGKSTVALDLCARLSTGRPMPDGSPGPGISSTIVLQSEDRFASATLPRLVALGADQDRVFRWRSPSGADEPFRIPSGIGQLKVELERTRARLAILALAEVLFNNDFLVVLVSRSYRQAAELFRKLTDFHRRLGEPLLERRNADELLLVNRSRVVCLPCKEETIRGFSGVDLLVLDEAAQVPDDIYHAVRPMLAVSAGRLICLSTPFGKRGFFWDAWANGGDDWARVEITAHQVPRIPPAFLFCERRGMGEAKFRREYLCSFDSPEGVVFPDFARCVVPGPAPTEGRRVGGMDFGFRNPFAAVWGILDRDGILWLTDEHYCRGKPLSFHAKHLPHGYVWYADPSGANERAELRIAGHTVCKGNNAIRPGLARISARLEAGTLRIVEGRCANLLSEAGLYAYSDDPNERSAEIPIDEHNHAISALRYLLSILDARGMAGAPRQGLKKHEPPQDSSMADSWLSYINHLRSQAGIPAEPPAQPDAPPPAKPRKSPNQDPDLWNRPEVWTRFG